MEASGSSRTVVKLLLNQSIHFTFCKYLDTLAYKLLYAELFLNCYGLVMETMSLMFSGKVIKMLLFIEFPSYINPALKTCSGFLVGKKWAYRKTT